MRRNVHVAGESLTEDDMEQSHERIDWKKLREAEARAKKYHDAHPKLETARELGWEPPTVLPPSWEILDRRNDGARYHSRMQSLVAIASVAREQDGKPWLHMSLSHANRMPKWRELREAKEIFIGDRECYMVFPTLDRHVNIHPHVLHLFACLEGPALPDFTKGTACL
jgi:hypothetical protein